MLQHPGHVHRVGSSAVRSNAQSDIWPKVLRSKITFRVRRIPAGHDCGDQLGCWEGSRAEGAWWRRQLVKHVACYTLEPAEGGGRNGPAENETAEQRMAEYKLAKVALPR